MELLDLGLVCSCSSLLLRDHIVDEITLRSSLECVSASLIGGLLRLLSHEVHESLESVLRASCGGGFSGLVHHTASCRTLVLTSGGVLRVVVEPSSAEISLRLLFRSNSVRFDTEAVLVGRDCSQRKIGGSYFTNEVDCGNRRRLVGENDAGSRTVTSALSVPNSMTPWRSAR